MPNPIPKSPEEEIGPLILPEPPDKEVPPGHMEEPLKLRYVEEIDLPSLTINIVFLIFLGFVTMFILRRLTNQSIAATIVSVVICWVVVVFFHNRLWTQVDGQSAKVYLDNIRRILVVYTQGFHFIPWYYTTEPEEINFQKTEIVHRCKKENTEVRFSSQDGLEIFVELDIFYKLREGRKALSKGLRFKPEARTELITAIVRQRLSDLGGCNSFKTLLAHKTEVAAYVAKIFGGEANLSDFEKETATNIKDPNLLNLDLTEGSREIYQARAKLSIVQEMIAKLREMGVKPNEAARMAQVLQGSASRIIHDYLGIPKNANVVALGDHGAAIAAGTGGNSNKSGGK